MTKEEALQEIRRLRKEASHLDGQANLHDYAGNDILRGMREDADKLRKRADDLESAMIELERAR